VGGWVGGWAVVVVGLVWMWAGDKEGGEEGVCGGSCLCQELCKRRRRSSCRRSRRRRRRRRRRHRRVRRSFSASLCRLAAIAAAFVVTAAAGCRRGGRRGRAGRGGKGQVGRVGRGGGSEGPAEGEARCEQVPGGLQLAHLPHAHVRSVDLKQMYKL
jgi:hypothetical protein